MSGIHARNAICCFDLLKQSQDLESLLQLHHNSGNKRSYAEDDVTETGPLWASDLLRLGAPWRLEGARLSWERGYPQMAIAQLNAFVQEISGRVRGPGEAAGQGTAGVGNPSRLQLAVALSLAGMRIVT